MANDEKINQLQLYEQSLQSLIQQKQQFQTQESEIDSALEALKTSTKFYKIIGNIMVDSKKANLEADLMERRAKAQLRIKAIEKQEESIKQKASALQKEIMDEMENAKPGNK